MAQTGKKSNDLDVLSAIYNHKGEKKKSFASNIKDFLHDDVKVEIWLARAILFVGIFSVIFGIFYFRNQIFSPYFSRNLGSGRQISLDQASSTIDLLGLSQKDTDQDGISDYDELNIYHTSPYLADSDSDGVNDLQEISRGSDPNCPEGKNCFSQPYLITGKNTESQSSGTQTPAGQLSADQIRRIMIDSGLPAESVNGLTDEEIIQLYQQAISNSYDSSSASPNLTLTKEQIQNLAPDEIRQLLHDQANIPYSTLDQITDEELMQYVNDTLKSF